MTERKPDIITKWSIKQNKDGIYESRCATLPNIVILTNSLEDACERIKSNLLGLYPGITAVSGGVTGITAEYGISKPQEVSLDAFSVPTDDPTPEPATDAPELHEVPDCNTCVIYRDGKCILSHKPESCNSYVRDREPVEEPLIQPPKKDTKDTKTTGNHTCKNCAQRIYCTEYGEDKPACDEFILSTRVTEEPPKTKKPAKTTRKPKVKREKKQDAKAEFNKGKCYTRCDNCTFGDKKGVCHDGKEPLTCGRNCDTCMYTFTDETGEHKFCDNEDSNCYRNIVFDTGICKHYTAEIPGEKHEVRNTCFHCIHRRDNTKCACEQSPKYDQFVANLDFACDQYKSAKMRLNELTEEPVEPADDNNGWKRITELTDTCENCINHSTKCTGNTVCENYNACNNSTEQCVRCEHFSRGYGKTGFCTRHDAIVGEDDYACRSWIENKKFKAWREEEEKP